MLTQGRGELWTCMLPIRHVFAYVDLNDGCPSNSPNDHVDGPTVGASCWYLNLSTSMGGTRSKVEGEDRHDLEPEGLRDDTRHKIYTGSGSQSSYPTSCLEYIAPCAWCCSPEGLWMFV
jgi:hypothetical protein